MDSGWAELLRSFGKQTSNRVLCFVTFALFFRLLARHMRWDRPGANTIMVLVALQQLNTWKNYWESQKHAAHPCRNIWSHLSVLLRNLALLWGGCGDILSAGSVKTSKKGVFFVFSINKALPGNDLLQRR